jgi:CBS domain-containing protein
VSRIVENEGEMWIDMQRFMLEEPRVATERSSLFAAIQLFWSYSLRHLPVVDHKTNELLGILTRENIVAFKRSQKITAKF